MFEWTISFLGRSNVHWVRKIILHIIRLIFQLTLFAHLLNRPQFAAQHRAKAAANFSMLRLIIILSLNN